MTIDVNISLFRYPTRRVPYDDTASLADFLRAQQVTQAWTGSFEGLLHQDLAGVNQRLADECKMTEGLLVPFGTVNPLLPDWEDDLRRCQDVHRMPGIRLFPGYHGYELTDARFHKLIAAAAERKLIAQIAVRLEDPRTQHPKLIVPDVNLAPLLPVVKQQPQLRMVLLNSLMSAGADLLAQLVEAGQVYFELATLEGVGGINRLLKSVPADRILFGSHAPFFIWQSADLKLKESDLPGPVIEQIRRGNARRLQA